MDRWKSTARKKLRRGESQKGEDKRWRRLESEKVRREKMQVRDVKTVKVGALVEVAMAKSTCRCGAKRIWKRKVSKTVTSGTLLDVEMSFC